MGKALKVIYIFSHLGSLCFLSATKLVSFLASPQAPAMIFYLSSVQEPQKQPIVIWNHEAMCANQSSL